MKNRNTVKNMALLFVVVLVVVVLTACGNSSSTAGKSEEKQVTIAETKQKEAQAETEQETTEEETVQSVAIKASPDKYTWYIKDYVGRNAASVGYTSLGGDRLDTYGAGHLTINYVSDTGEYIDIEDEDLLKQYVVKGQNIEPNTELKITFLKDSEGNEYDNLTDDMSIEEIDLLVVKKGSEISPSAPELVAINPSPNKYTKYIRNYVGKNAASVGYYSLGGDRMDAYGNAHLEIIYITSDGSYIEPDDTETLSKYVIVAQDIAPNTEMTMTYMTDSEGNEYDNLVDSQSFDSIALDLALIE